MTAHNAACGCSECMAGKLGQSMPSAPAPDDDDDEDIDPEDDAGGAELRAVRGDGGLLDDPARDELAVRLSALELAGQRRDAELRSAHVKLEAQERRIDELESSVRAISTTLSELGATLRSTNAVLERLAALVPAPARG